MQMALNQTLMEIKVIGMILNYLCTKSKHAKLLFWSPQKTLRCVFCAPVVLFQDNFFQYLKKYDTQKKMLKIKIKDIHKCYKSVLNNFFVRCLQVVEKITSFFFEFRRQKRPYRAILREKIVKFFFRILFYGSWATIKPFIMFILRQSEPPQKQA